MLTKKYEHRSQPVLPRRRFYVRLTWSGVVAATLMCCALAIGIVGYHLTESLHWIDALLEASMILGGMGPVNPIKTDAGKLFASFYALFSGIVFLSMSAVLMAPLLHRLLHQLHADPPKEK